MEGVLEVDLGGFCSKPRPLCYAPMLPTTSYYAGLGTINRLLRW